MRIGRRVDKTAVLVLNLGIGPFLAAHNLADQERILVVIERRLVLVVHLQHAILAVDVGQCGVLGQLNRTRRWVLFRLFLYL